MSKHDWIPNFLERKPTDPSVAELRRLTVKSFIAPILADPDNDALRLVYADWLEEHGEPERAEFIRVQCQLAVLHPDYQKVIGPTSEWEELHALRRRERELYPLARNWCNGFPDWWTPEDPRFSNVTFRRGFAHSLTCTAADWLAHADAILREHPVREVRLTTWPNGSHHIAGDGSFHGILPGRGYRAEKTLPVGATLDERLLAAEWPGIMFTLPDVGPSPMRPILQEIMARSPAACECGADTAGTTHANWCPKK